jgi:antirestriction protein ArdC
MSTSTLRRLARVRPGVREGGQFATDARTEPEVTLPAAGHPLQERFDTLEEKLAAFHAELEQQVADLDSDENWLAWLDMQSKFHDYSFSNTLLIALQRPDATRVAGYRKWQEMGRQVRAGERGIAILAPRTAWAQRNDAAGNPVVGADGKPERVRRVVGWTTATVFDVSQTDGDPLPTGAGRVNQDGEPPEGLTEDLEAAIAAAGFTVSYEPVPGAANGYTSPDGRVVVDSSLTPAQRAGTLAHELGHISAGHLEHLDEYHIGHGGQRHRFEVEAESIGYALLRSAGMRPPAMASGAYVKGWAGVDRDAKVVKESAGTVAKTVKELLTGRPWRHLEPAA